jgi:hypothetical protein
MEGNGPLGVLLGGDAFAYWGARVPTNALSALARGDRLLCNPVEGWYKAWNPTGDTATGTCARLT